MRTVLSKQPIPSIGIKQQITKRNEYVILYHPVSTGETLGKILTDGLVNSRTLGKQIPLHPVVAKNYDDIFFRVSRNDGTTDYGRHAFNLPYVAIRVDINCGLPVNSSYYSFGELNDPMLIPLPVYLTMTEDEIKQRHRDGLSEVRIKTTNIDPKYIVQFGRNPYEAIKIPHAKTFNIMEEHKRFIYDRN